MPKRQDISSILIIGAGPIVVGQACEFDYSGTQGAKALKEEGYRVILVNSNPATIMTDPQTADKIYLEPITAEFITQIIEKEKPDAILPTLGGQTALNATLELDELGILKKHGVKLLGANVEAINKAEDRGLFKKAMEEIGLECPKSVIVNSLEEAVTQKDFVGIPAIIRPSLTLGGTGGGVANTFEEFLALVQSGLEASPINQIQIDESLIGWKEYEMEVVRDKNDNAIIVCSIENIDPMGVHTGDSITVAPILTLTDKEYQKMRNASIAILRKIGVETGGSNVQFAVNPKDGRMVVIEMNPRVSRSSALASKATGFPIAKVAAKLAVGYTLDELRNDIACSIPREFSYAEFRQIMEAIAKTQQNGEGISQYSKYAQTPNQNAIFQYIQNELHSGTSMLKLSQKVLPASFEPAIDYVVVKIPKFNFEKFSDVNSNVELGTQMQSIGEVMAIGRSFEEAFMKAVSSMEEPWNKHENLNLEECKKMLSKRLPNRFSYIFRGFQLGLSAKEIIDLTKYDKWFIERFENIYNNLKYIQNKKEEAKTKKFECLTDAETFKLKQLGISDLEIRSNLEIPAGTKGKHLFKESRIEKNIRPIFKKVDTCAGEFETQTNYFYSTYEEENFNEAKAIDRKKTIIIGSGPNRIGQGIEFDYACVHGAYALKEIGIEPIIINCNPETVSTDYDTSTRLYFEPATAEHVMAVIENELEIPCEAYIEGKKLNTIFEIYKEALKRDFKMQFQMKFCPMLTLLQRQPSADLQTVAIGNREYFTFFLSHYISVIIQFGGQTPLKLRDTLFEYGIPILGMQTDTVDICDHREKFTPILDEIQIKYPQTFAYNSKQELDNLAQKLNYNFIVRPSSVIGGRGMAIIASKEEYEIYEYVSGGIVNEMLEDATEFDCDAIRDHAGNTFICGVLQHVEFAGVHSGDSACVLPPHTASLELQSKIEEIAYKLAQKLSVIGLINIQFAVKDGEIFVIEANPRCSRTMPFIAKATNFPVIKVATKLMHGFKLEEIKEFQSMPYKKNVGKYFVIRNLPHFAVKEAVFSFEKFAGSDIILGPEMKSTGEVIGISQNLQEAFAKAIIGTKYKLPKSGKVFISVKDKDKNAQTITIAKNMVELGFAICATKGTKDFLEKNGLKVSLVKKISEGSPTILELISQKEIVFVINTTEGIRALTDSFHIRKLAVRGRVLHATRVESAQVMVDAIAYNKINDCKIF